MKLSIVTTLYKSALHLEEFYRRSSLCAQQIYKDDYEIIMVNDGSPDNSLDIAIKLQSKDSHLKVINLSRNFGHHKAMMTGLKYCCGDLIYLIDSDLEEEPEWLIEFNEELIKQQSDVIYGVQKIRKGGTFERWSGKLFYSLFKFLTDIPLSENLVTARLMTKQYVKALLLHKEREIFMAGLCYITGFKQQPIIIKKHSTSPSSYTLNHKISLLTNSVVSFSNFPLKIIFYIGLFISLVASFYVIYLIINWIYFSTPLNGWTSVIASIWLLGGLITLFIGIIGIYLSKIFLETKRRPYTIVKNIYEN
ncbi:MAG: putative rane protein [Francisellaceae bacterium]|nr:putative rane protein [Francisellaceae bacterium]